MDAQLVSRLLLSPEPESESPAEALLVQAGFDAPADARGRFRALARGDAEQALLAKSLPGILYALSEGAAPDASLINLERFIQAVEDRGQVFRYLAEHPRAVEILFRLFVGSQFLTEILLRNPQYLDRLTQHKRLADVKSRPQFIEEGRSAFGSEGDFARRMDALRRFQQWELLRLAACDTFGLMDMKSVTLQLALLADSLAHLALECSQELLGLSADDFSVLGFGKLGGEELNYSSDIDLVFVCRSGSDRYWGLGQKLINALAEPTAAGFLYRVDMRLRPWGRSGPLVSTINAYVEYMKKNGRMWEKQALLKARVIAGNQEVGAEVLKRLEPFIYEVDREAARENVADMKRRIEEHLAKKGRAWGEVKGGQGSIRDVEFVTQYLQLAHGGEIREIRTFNTLDALVRLTEFDLIRADEYRQLSSGYVFLRTVEHALQLMHNKQEHALPRSQRELAYLARRLDYPGADEFLSHYTQHCRAIRAIYEKYILRGETAVTPPEITAPRTVDVHLGDAAAGYHEIFTPEQAQRHLRLLDQLDDENIVRTETTVLPGGTTELTVAGYDLLGDLSLMCGLLFVTGWNIESGWVFTGSEVFEPRSAAGGDDGRPARDHRRRKFVNVFVLREESSSTAAAGWSRYTAELEELLRLAQEGKAREAQGRLVKRVARALRERTLPKATTAAALLPVEIDIDNESDAECTVMQIRAEDTIGFLYELSNSLAVSGVSIHRVRIWSEGREVLDTLHVVDQDGHKIVDPARLSELRAAVVLTKHFTHLLPQSPNPESALVQFREFLEHLFRQPNWLEQLGSLQQTEVLAALATLLGVSEFLWHDFLRLQHENLFPVVADVQGLKQAKPLEDLRRELRAEIDAAEGYEAQCAVLNAFKDREMLRVDMRHILNLQDKFLEFSRELTDVAEAVVAAAVELAEGQLLSLYGEPRLGGPGSPERARLAVCALGKCGGFEMGYASDVELMFVYEGDGRTAGPEKIANVEYFQKLVDLFREAIHAKRKGIFEIDLRLRPYGKAGSPAVSLETFAKYFSAEGAAWPYERQALVKLRPIAGDAPFGERVEQVRDSLIYTGQPFDVAAMRGMREKQNRQLVRPGTFNAKLSPGGLVDCEYLVQGLQITYGHDEPSLRATNTREAMKALEKAGVLTPQERLRLRDTYRFLRRLIDALRMVRGDASDLAVPPADSEEFEFLARRLGYQDDATQLSRDLDEHTHNVIELSRVLDQHVARARTAK